MRFLLLFLLLASLSAAAQPAADPIPGLRRALAQARTDSAQGRIYWALSEYTHSTDSTLWFARQAEQRLQRALPGSAGAERPRLCNLLGAALNNVAVGLEGQGQPQQAAGYYRRALRLRKQGGDVRGQVESLLCLGTQALNENDYAQAVRCLQQGVQRGEPVPAARSQVATCLSMLGRVYSTLGDSAARLRYQLRAVALLERGGEPMALLANLMLVADTYRSYVKELAPADAYARRAQELAQRTPGAESQLANALAMRGHVALQQRRLPAARALLLEARRLATRNQSPAVLASVQNALAETEEQAGNLPLALRYACQPNAYFANSFIYRRENQLIQGRLAEKMGQLPAALYHFKRWSALRDSVQNEQNQRAAFQQRVKYEYAGKAAAAQAAEARREAVAAAELRRQKLLRTATTVGAGLLLLLAGVLYNRFRFQRRATAAITREKGRSDELLHNILPAEVAAELMNTGKTTARHFDRVTVLFSDVVGFTQLAETLTPQQLVATLDVYFGAFDAITTRFGLEKIKTIGDSYMLAGGLGQGLQADPAVTVRAALAMVAAVAELQAQRVPLGLPWFALRIGLHTGPVVAGVVGVKKFAYDIWGDTVNTASRMESAGEAGRVNVSGDTYALVADRFRCTPRGKLAAKHKGEMEMYFVEAEQAEQAPSIEVKTPVITHNS